MTRFAVIEPLTKTVRNVTRSELARALKDIDLDSNHVDYGMVNHHVLKPGGIRHGIITYEFALHLPPASTAYFALAGDLFSGNCLLYGVGSHGETINACEAAQLVPHVMFLRTEADVEAAIRDQLVQRPQIKMNGIVIWSWPQPMIGSNA